MSTNDDLITAMGLAMHTTTGNNSGDPVNQLTTSGDVPDTLKIHYMGNSGVQIKTPRYQFAVDPFEDIKDKIESQKKKIKEELKKKMQFDDIIKEVKEWKVKK